MDGAPWEGQKHKSEPVDMRTEGPTRGKGLCLLVEKGDLAQLDGTGLLENLDAPGEEFRVDYAM